MDLFEAIRVVLVVFLHEDVRVGADEEDLFLFHARHFSDTTVPLTTSYNGLEWELEDGKALIVRIEKHRGRADLQSSFSLPVKRISHLSEFSLFPLKSKTRNVEKKKGKKERGRTF